jgi:hypothetical protein
MMPCVSYSFDLRASATALCDGKGCLTNASSSLNVFVVIGDRSLSVFAVVIAKSSSMSATVTYIQLPLSS